jgi:peptidoglycan/xylan/chitin deacetylase (PgdA/CDA1 family)
MSFATELPRAAAELANAMATNPVIRTVNFHNTPLAKRAIYERQFEQWSKRFTRVSEEDLYDYLGSGNWPKEKPGLIIALYEGYRSNYEVMVPLLERFGFTGWFFVITGFVETPVPEQLKFAKEHDIAIHTHEYDDDGRYAVSWEELKKIDGRHVVASHARTHRFLAEMNEADKRSEIVGSQEEFARNLGHPVRTFVSYGGPPFGADTSTDQLIREARYQMVFSNLRIQRIA